MTTVTTSADQVHTCDKHEDNSYQFFVKGINQSARLQYQKVTELGEEIKALRLVRTKVNIFQAYLNSFSDERRQQYNCRACERFLNGIGTFATIDDNNKLVPLVFNFEDDGWVPENFTETFNVLRAAFDVCNAGTFDIVTTNMVDELGDFLGTSVVGGFNHFALTLERVAVVNDLKCNAFDTQAKRHGVGKAEITLIHTWLRDIAEFNFDSLVDLHQIRENDREIIGHIRNAVEAYKTSNPDIYVRRTLIDQGLGLLYLKNSAAGTIIENMAKGKSFEVALEAYLAYVDPRYYKRPLRMPSETQFEESVKWLEEKGYAEKLPVRFAVPEEVHELCAWVKPREEVAEVKKGIFDKARTVVADQSTKQPDTPVKIEVPLENISMATLVTILKKHIADNTLVGIRHTARRLMVGSFVTCVAEDGYEIYRDGKNTRNFLLVDPLHDFQVQQVMSPATPKDDTITGVIFDSDDYGRDIVFFVKENHQWKIPLQSVVIPDDLLPEIQQHRRTIEHWCKTTPMNIDDKDQLIIYDNTVVNVALSVEHGVYVETDKHVFQFAIASVR